MQHSWRRRLTGAVVTSLAAAVVAVPMASADIDTTPAWDGVNAIGLFGPSATPAYGQTVTGLGEALTGFTVQMQGDSPLTFRGGVGEWDGSQITAVLWSGPDQSTVGTGAFEAVSFELPDGVPLAPGHAYVLYATAVGGSGYNVWGAVDGATYDGGSFVYWYDGWSETYENWDLAFQARFGNTVNVVFVPLPARGGYCTVEGNSDPFTGAKLAPGTFVNLEQAQVTTDPSYTGVVPAIYVEGKGLTCDAPPAGFTQQGLAGDDQQVASGLYPYYAAPKA